MPIMMAPTTVATGTTFKMVLTGNSYTVDINGYVTVASESDLQALLVQGFSLLPRINTIGVVDPGATNDASKDYQVGSMWRNGTTNPSRWWICDDATIGAAIWVQISVGANASNAGSANFINLVLTGQITESAATITAFNGGGQASATSLTSTMNYVNTAIASTSPYDSVKFAGTVVGTEQFVYNAASNPIQLFGTGSATINGFSSSVGITLQPGQSYAGRLLATNTWWGTVPGLGFSTNCVYNTNTATSGTTVTGANITGAVNNVVLNMTGTLSGDALLTLPLVSNLVLAMPNQTNGYSYMLRIINSSSGAHMWTVTTNTGWTLNAGGGNLTIPQNTWRDFIVTMTSSSAATLQSVGTVGSSGW